MRSNMKSVQAEIFVEACDDYGGFYEDFVKTFKLSRSQCIALRHLCELAEKYGKQLAEIQTANVSTVELFEIYRSENYQKA